MDVSHALSVQLVKWKEELLKEKLVEKSIEKHPGFLLAVLNGISDSDCLQKVTIGLSKLSWKFPVVARFAEEYYAKHGSPLQTIGSKFQFLKIDEPKPKKRKRAAVNVSSKLEEGNLEMLLTATLIILLKLPRNVFASWGLEEFLNLRDSSSTKIRWLSAQCLRILLNLSDDESVGLLQQFELTEEQITVHSVAFDEELNNVSAPQTPISNVLSEYFPDNEINQVTPNLDLLSVGGIIVQSKNPLDPSRQQPFETLNIVPLPSVLDSVKKVLLQVQRGTAVCIAGPIGVGKSSLVTFTASICGKNQYPDVITVQMSDQVDSRLLLGSYHSTDLPGQFIWKAGCLTKAILNGHWIVFEDLNSAPIDVITLLDAISDTKQVMVPGYGQITHFHPEFRMFATVRLSGNRKDVDKSCKSWVTVSVNEFNSDELIIIMKVLFPFLAPITDRIAEIFVSVKTMSGTNKRAISVRDLLKFCQRLPKGLDLSSTNSAILIFHEACDVFVAPLRDFDEKLALAQVIGTHLNLLNSKVEYFLTMSKPQVSICGNSGILVAGRFELPMFQQLPASKREDIGVYSLTKRVCSLLEMVAGAVKNEEPILLIGETGVGKTSSIQYLAKILHQKMVVVNLNRQSDSSDLLGGYKPVELKYIFSPLREEFEALFAASFDRGANNKFLNHIMTCFANSRWKDLLELMSHVQKSALKKSLGTDVVNRWKLLGSQISRVSSQINDGSESPFAFAFIEGTLIDAVRNGYWILLDEINLADSEMLQCLSGVLDKTSQIHLWEKGDEQPVQRHPNFHLFAAMNPSTDIGKKDLPIGIRNRFTEIFVDELTDEDELRVLVSDYLSELSLTSEQISNIVEFYTQVKLMSKTSLIDGMGKRPHFSLRTLCRALKISSYNLFGSVRRSLFESFCLSFLTQLDYASHPVVKNLIAKQICGKTEVKALLSQPLPPPSNSKAVLVEGYWLPCGSKDPKSPNKYILTPSVRRNLKDIARIVSAGKLPVLIQGETSVGKTSLIHYLADATGNTCYRINNHQHTDLQEYVGSYQSDKDGRLVFTEGVLVQAMRSGQWIILDELNLAPSEVLEALNRLLDDNRQLFITETGVTVTAHPRFMLFATQNPPGLYGGRKLLSRAFRNRFVELHFDEIPTKELEDILHQRCDIPMSYCKKIIGVLKELQTRRKSSAALQGKHSFATLRDLFRWAERYRQSGQPKGRFYDWDQHLADEGYLVLAGKARKSSESEVIRDVLQKYLKRTVDPNNLFSLHENTSTVTKDILSQVLNADIAEFKHIVWTYPMRRLAVLIGSSMKFKEPVLLVGETGAGKTSVVQILTHIYGRNLYSINCHMHSESSDFLGGLRPVRQHDVEEHKLFEWVDGPLVEAMERGGIFLADEISLADDSVLERLNSVLEPERTLLIAEKGDETPKLIVAHDAFHFIGTMNPGGDFGKKELSPALRNRLTEIWCESTTEDDDLSQIIEHNLAAWLKRKGISSVMIKFVRWLKNNEVANRCTVSVRDYLSWVTFANHTTSSERGYNKLSIPTAMEHGACLSFLDGLGVGNTATEYAETTRAVRESGLNFLFSLVTTDISESSEETESTIPRYTASEHMLQLGPFTLDRSTFAVVSQIEDTFTIESPTTRINALRLFRAMQLNKPILLEGSPGQGKTALVSALAKAAGFPLTRINLSEQTDISDLFGADLPVEGKEGGHFAWRDGPLLQALKCQAWILLDELNLASQSVLEGLNACLDHRGEVFVPELNRTFKIHDSDSVRPATRIFACQNPLRQGGARKGLPKSFLNRFTQVYVDTLSHEDMKFIVQRQTPILNNKLVDLMTTFASSVHEAVCVQRRFGRKGSPWDFNLRDLMRWSEITCGDFQGSECVTNKHLHPELFVDLIYGLRMRSSEDRKSVLQMFYSIWFNTEYEQSVFKDLNVLEWGRSEVQILPDQLKCGRATITRNNNDEQPHSTSAALVILQKHLPVIEGIISCLSMGWMPILVGASGVGKTATVKLIANICGKQLEIINPSPEMDTIELLGGFEQADIYRKIDETCVDVSNLLLRFVKKTILLGSADYQPTRSVDDEEGGHHRKRIADVDVGKSDNVRDATHSPSARPGLDWQLLDLWKSIKTLPHLTPDGTLGHAEEIKRIENRVDFLERAYLRCKSFFETEYGGGGGDLGKGKVKGMQAPRDEDDDDVGTCGGHNGKKKRKQDEDAEEVSKGNYAKTPAEVVAAAKQHLDRVSGELEQIFTHLKAGIQTGSFQWIDSILIKSLLGGNWLLIDGANRCSAAVLDRLNSLMEPNGSLLLSERGSLDGKIVEIRPHPNFRLILSMDPAFGEISRAMRNRGVEIFMSNSLSSTTKSLWEGESSHMDIGTGGQDDGESPDVAVPSMDVDCPSGTEPEREVGEDASWTGEDFFSSVETEFGISVFDLESLLKVEGMCNPRLRAAVLNFHRTIHRAVACRCSPSSETVIPSGGALSGVMESGFSKMITTWRQMVLQMENGISYKDAMWDAFTFAYVEGAHSGGMTGMMDPDKKVEIQEMITRYCQGLDDDFIGKLTEKPLPIRTVTDCGSSQAFRIWKGLEVISNALSETSWSQYESWRGDGSERKSLVENFLILSVFSTVMKKDVGGLLLALSNRYPLKEGFAQKLTSVLESTSGWKKKSFLSLHNYADIQRDAHLMVKFADEGEGEQRKCLDSQLKISLKLHSLNEIFTASSSSLENVRKGSLGFVAKNVKKTDAGNLFEFLYGFWQIVSKYEKLLETCLSSSYTIDKKNLNEKEEIKKVGEGKCGGSSCNSIIAQYSHVWVKGMIAILWRKWMAELVQEEFNCKRPSEKLKSNVALLVQWIGEQVVPTLHAIKGIDNSFEGNELESLVANCLEPLDHCGNRILLQRSASFRSFYGIRPFLPRDTLSFVNSTLSLCLKLWIANAPVDLEQVETLLISCSSGYGAEASHRHLSGICKKIMKIDTTPISSDEAAFLEKLNEELAEILEKPRTLFEDPSSVEDPAKSISKVVRGIHDFIRLLSIPAVDAKYSVFHSPLLQALEGESGEQEQYEFLQTVLHWEDEERFRRHYTNCPPSITTLKSCCLLPYFISKIILDDDSHLLRSASFGSREILSSHYKALNRQLTNEIIRPRMTWEDSTGLVQETGRSVLEMTHRWASMFLQDESLLRQINGWSQEVETILARKVGDEHSREIRNMAELGCVLVESSCSIMEYATYLPVVDPSVENEVLAKYLTDEIDYFTAWKTAQRVYSLYTTGHDICSRNGIKSDSGYVHPYVQEVSLLLQTSAKRLKEAETNIAARPDPPEYEDIRHVAMQFVRSMASKARSEELTNRVRNLFRSGSSHKPTEDEINAVLIPCSSWLETCSNFIQKHMKRFWYWDISLSYLEPAVQAIKGFSLICDSVRRIRSLSNVQTKAKILTMMEFPSSHTPKVSDASGIYEEPWAYKRATKKLLLSSLWSFYNKVMSYECITPNLMSDLHEFSKELARLWKEQQEEKERQKEMENAFYVYKGRERKVEASEEEQEMENIANIFPDFSTDFQDLVENDSFEAPSASSGTGVVTADINLTNSSDIDILENDDVELFLKVHSSTLSFIKNNCLMPGKFVGKQEFTIPFVNTFEVGCFAFQNSYLDYYKDDEDGVLIASNLLMKRLEHEISIGTEQDIANGVYDIYRDPNVAEVMRLSPVLSGMRKRIKELLEQWPEHPALLRITELMDRIETFDVKSPVIKFLRGLEMLLPIAEEWEQVAHRKVSIKVHTLEVSELVISWRKLELSYWKNLLKLNFAKEQRVAKQWWFHLFFSTIEFTLEDSDDNEGSDREKKFLKVLQSFMESSPLGQYITRLWLLEELHRHVTGLLQTPLYDNDAKQGFKKLAAYIWNSVVYYKQFVLAVNARLKSLSAPVEKSMKDFIEISRWTDANFYALQDSVKKSQKKLNKLVTDYKKVLNIPASTVLVSDVSNVESQLSEKKKGNLKKTKKSLYLLQDITIDKIEQEVINQLFAESSSAKRVSKVDKYYQKSREISQKLMDEDETCANQLEEVDDLSTTIIETVHDLQNLPVPEEKGDKRRKALHHVHNLRRTNLAELFKTLQSLGLSFRRGLIHLKALDSETNFYDFGIEPTDLSVGWANLRNFSADSELTQAWKGCENYFQKCISRISVMLKSFHNPSKELGPNIIDRCKGYVVDLLQNILQEKFTIGRCGNLLWELRSLLEVQKQRVDRRGDYLVCNAFAEKMFKASCDMEIEYKQYIIVSDSLVGDNSSVKILLKSTCESVLAHLSTIKTKLTDIVSNTPVRDLYASLVDKDILLECSSKLEEALGTIEASQQSMVVSSVIWISLNKSKNKWRNWLQAFKGGLESPSTMEGSTEMYSFSNAVSNALEAVLISYQRLDALTGENAGGSDDTKFTDMVPAQRLDCLNLEAVVQNVLRIRHILNSTTGEERVHQMSIFAGMIPLISQFALTAQFYLKLLTQQHRTTAKLLSILSAVFTTLGQKGFCLPADYENDAVEEGQEMDAKSGMGLGEGETTSDAQDVSDRLESEDQLDDTMQAGETAESADKDVGEDDKGVEMSEDFGGKLQDKQEKKGDEDQDEKSDDDQKEEEDVEKEMGDVDPDGEKIDDKLWGGSDEEEEEEPQPDKKEKGKGSHEKGEKELSSNQDQEEGDDGQNEDEDSANNEPQNKEYDDHNEDEEPNDDQTDPYHGQNEPQEEPEAMELPDDLQLDNADAKDETEEQEKNPFDLDATERELPEGFDEEENEEENENPDGEKLDEISEDEEKEDASMNDINVDASQLDQSEMEETTPEDKEPGEDTSMEVDEEKEPDEDGGSEKEKVDTPSEDAQEAEETPEPSAVPSHKKDSSAANSDSSKDKESFPVSTEEEENPSKSEDQATGQVESKDGQGQEGKSLNKDMSESRENNKNQDDASRRPGETDSKRSLADNADNIKDQLRRLKTVENSDSLNEKMDEEMGDDGEANAEHSAEVYQHIQSSEKKDSLTIDNATKEQLERQKGMQIDDDKEKTDNPLLDDDNEDMEVDDDDLKELDEAEIDKHRPDLIRGLPENKKKQKNSKNLDDSELEKGEVEGEKVLTMSVQRPADSYSHTNLELLKEKSALADQDKNIEMIDLTAYEASMSYGNEASALVEWHDLDSKTLPLSQELCEQLRLILEPTQAARLKGDYKTGKRLNMRKVIPYIASGFRKDKIWLRRTQPSKREYQILLALDDSSSMLDNQSKQMAFSAVAVVARALSLLEAGKLAVGSFGEDVKLIHSFDEAFTDVSGARIIQQFTFAQKRTRIAQLMQYSTALFSQSRASSSGSIHPDVAQLMIIISDGRGINNEGVDSTKRAIMRAREQNIFIVFIIVDNPENQNSILDIRQPVFGPNNSVEIVRYMDNFPFPFYLILRDITSLPSVLSDALRQWFELVTSSDR